MASDVPPPVEFSEPGPLALASDEKTWGMLCHLSALAGYFVGGLGIIGPLICWLIKKDTSKFVDDQGKEALNFQINMLGYALILIAISFATCGFGLILAIPLGIALAGYGIVMPIMAGISANGGTRYRYPALIRLIK